MRIQETPALAGSATPTDAMVAPDHKADYRETQHELIGFVSARDFLPLANQVSHVANACEVTGDDTREARAVRSVPLDDAPIEIMRTAFHQFRRRGGRRIAFAQGGRHPHSLLIRKRREAGCQIYVTRPDSGVEFGLQARR